MADIEILRYLATKTGLGLNYLSKDEKISIILEQQRDLFPEVVLKGGTALSRVYLAKKGVSRFSEDIDLDFISDKGLNEKISTIKDRVKEIFRVLSHADRSDKDGRSVGEISFYRDASNNIQGLFIRGFDGKEVYSSVQ